MKRYGESAHRLRLEPFSLGPFGGDSPAFFFLLSPLFSLPALRVRRTVLRRSEAHILKPTEQEKGGTE